MDMIAVLSKDLEVYYFKKSSIECLYTHKGEVTIDLINGRGFHIKYKEIVLDTSKINSIKNNNTL